MRAGNSVLVVDNRLALSLFSDTCHVNCHLPAPVSGFRNWHVCQPCFTYVSDSVVCVFPEQDEGKRGRLPCPVLQGHIRGGCEAGYQGQGSSDTS